MLATAKTAVGGVSQKQLTGLIKNMLINDWLVDGWSQARGEDALPEF